MQEPREFRIDIGDIELSVFEWPGDGDPVLLLHATGFHSRCWNEVVRRLPGQHIYAVDLRFHGASDNLGDANWAVLVKDICLLIEQLDLSRLIGVGHSIGGYLITMAAAKLPEKFRQLMLIDPVIMSPESYAHFHDLAETLAAADHPVSRRKNRWQDADEMYRRFQDRHPFNSWQPQVLRDYCDYALRPATEGDYLQLACDPLNEASIYLGQEDNEVVLDTIKRLHTPVLLMRAPTSDNTSSDLSTSPTWTELSAHLPNCEEIYLPQHNHFIPMQDPELVAKHLIRILGR